MTKRTRLAVAVTLGVLGSLITAVPASTAAPLYYFMGYAGGSQVQVLGNTIKSDLTGRSVVSGFKAPASDKNRIAGTNVAKGLVKIGAINTYAQARRVDKGVKIKTGARTADVSLLGGVIEVDAVETDTVAVRKPNSAKHRSNTKFLGLTIAGTEYPVNVSKNTTVTIPGIATVVLNGSFGDKSGKSAASYGFGLAATLLKPSKNLPAGATVVLNPTASMVQGSPPVNTPIVGGVGYGTFVQASVGELLEVDAGRTGAIALPLNGTGGKTIENSTASVNLPEILNLGVVRSTANGKIREGFGRAKVTNQTAGVKVLGNLITADAIKVVSKTIKRKSMKKPKKKMRMTFVNLKINGETILPIDVSPNTEIRIDGVAVIRLNKRSRSSFGASIVGLEIVLLNPKGDVPAGSIIQLAAASSYVVPQQ